MNSYEIEIGKKGLPTLKYNNKYIYSSYDPKLEAEKFLSSKQNLKKIVITCCGMDYINIELKKLGHYDIISFDPIKFNNEKLSNITYTNNLIDLEKELLQRDSIDISFIIWPPLVESNPDFYLPKLKKINEIIEKIIYSKNSENYFGFIETKNIIRNLINENELSILTNDNIKRDFALIISSGNSLKDNIKFIKNIKDRVYTFALPSSLPFLYNKNIEPDFVIAVDSGFATYYHLSKYKKTLNLICPLTIHPAVFKLNNYKKIVFSYNTNLESRLYENGIEDSIENNIKIIKSHSEGSVFINLLRILKKLNFSDVILIGQDFGYYKNRGHIDGGFFESEFLENSSILNPLEKQFKILETKKDVVYIKNGDNEIKTDRSLKVYYNHFIENDFSLNFYSTQHSNFINNDKIKILDEPFFHNYETIKDKNLPTKIITIENSKKILFNELKNGLKKDNLMSKLINFDPNNSLHNITIEKLLKLTKNLKPLVL